MAGLIEQPKHYTRAEAQEQLAERSAALVIRRAALDQMARLREQPREDPDAIYRTINHADLQSCIASGRVIEDVGYCKGGAMLTVAGPDCEGNELVVHVYLADDENLPLFIEKFVLKP